MLTINIVIEPPIIGTKILSNTVRIPIIFNNASITLTITAYIAPFFVASFQQRPITNGANITPVHSGAGQNNNSNKLSNLSAMIAPIIAVRADAI
ncbi:hypothetical protein [Clostridioides difficile]|uniref:hypothetical protein n=1 Tax=Clostridioides difficile TaxID=1496 RepID=UPI001F275263|nr:hypothetical protein [Clostridioides difficile]